MVAYIALIHKEANSDFGVSFPDLPGCVSVGSTQGEARAHAAEALALHIDGMLGDRADIPAPSDLDTIMADRANIDAIAVRVEIPRKS